MNSVEFRITIVDGDSALDIIVDGVEIVTELYLAGWETARVFVEDMEKAGREVEVSESDWDYILRETSDD